MPLSFCKERGGRITETVAIVDMKIESHEFKPVIVCLQKVFKEELYQESLQRGT